MPPATRNRRPLTRYAACLLLALLIVLPTLTFATPLSAQTTSRTFPETGKTVQGKFLQYWDTHGGLFQQGYPISNEMQEISDTDGNTYTVQYFERAVFELHPEKQPPYEVLLQLLGVFYYEQRYTEGAPDEIPNDEPGFMHFEETGQQLGGVFLEYWRTHGGLMQQGYPISDEFQEKSNLDGKTYKVQYFERAVFELHPENAAPYNVLLSQLGTFRYRDKHPAAVQAPSPLQVDFMRNVGVLYMQRTYYQAQAAPIWEASQRRGVTLPFRYYLRDLGRRL